jgi:hypothetical protein
MAVVDPHERRECLGQECLALSLPCDVFGGRVQEPREGYGGGDGTQPVDVLEVRLEQAGIDQAGEGVRILVGNSALAQRAGVQLQACLARLVGSVPVRPCGHLWLSSLSGQ